ncbi:uncharacterized protein KY384_003713 [Bacidia gigantensis]|uniref:uncharacterized protein n=1 Tax=Bacidia gigantensis TaxID=2732470 RepID=UPI001D04B070|nr:uncharacterized protein KY384_003713 [Bacidia gigantensis]KAG8532076.1 hypothetical protein KY384_003713 [Bacidia gigantensis]
MLDWSAGPLRAADALSAPLNEGVSCIDEPPDTPAHVFALRAFKTAIFGTPHPEQQVTVGKPEIKKNPAALKGTNASKQTGEVLNLTGESRRVSDEQIPSPTKGILLTPGIGTSRRKNVSFMHFQEEVGSSNVGDIEAEEVASSQDNSPTRRRHKRDMRPRPSSLTRKLVGMSKREPIEAVEMEQNRLQTFDSAVQLELENDVDHAVQTSPDHTLDLSQPRSQSGQHWKTEYDQYLGRSRSEIKRVLQHGQNVKSYAVQKDAEAAMLSERLRFEEAKVRALERRVSKLTDQLDVAQTQDPKGQGEYARLVSELAQQTALVARHKRSLERHEGLAFEDCSCDSKIPVPRAHGESLEKQLRSLREAAQEAGQRAEKAEAENTALKQSLARVKEEMMGYESRRKTREERLKNKEGKFKAAKDLAEDQLSHLRQEHQKLLESRKEQYTPSAGRSSRMGQRSSNGNKSQLQIQGQRHQILSPKLLKENQRPGKSISPRRRRQQNPAIDIWTMSSPRGDNKHDKIAKTQEISDLPPSSVKQDIQKALKEINLNIIPHQSFGMSSYTTSEKPLGVSPGAIGKKEPLGYEDGVPVWMETSPTIPQHLASSRAKLQQQSGGFDSAETRETSYPTIGRSASMLSGSRIGPTRIDSITSTKSNRTPMTAEGKAAARARLAEKNATKKQPIEGN